MFNNSWSQVKYISDRVVFTLAEVEMSEFTIL